MARAHESDTLDSALLVWIAAVTALAVGLVLGLYQIVVREAVNL
jgi:hypothetical protein